MPGRKDIFLNNGIYHIFNRTIDKRILFQNDSLSQYFLDTFSYYRSEKADICFSQFLRSADEIKKLKYRLLGFNKYFKIDLLGFCLMPTHFHFLIRQVKNKGIVSFMRDFLNSFTRYYNIKFRRKGPLFLPRFQSRAVMTDNLLNHVLRYIHLNPYSGRLIKNLTDLEAYRYSSYKEYVGNKSQFTDTSLVLGLFNNNKMNYRQFVNDQADYQRSLEDLKYIDKW